MKFHNDEAEIYFPEGDQLTRELQKITHLAIAAHPDDLEIMASSAILMCMEESDKNFAGVIVTDGRGSPRGGRYKNLSDAQMRLLRRKEQKKAAVVGEYSVLILLDYQSRDIKNKQSKDVIDDLTNILINCQPEIVFTHNLADKHDTHVVVALRTIQAIRSLPGNIRPHKLIGCEIWRDLDWMLDEDKLVFDLSYKDNLQLSLLGVFDSQISGGKRYDLAAIGRRIAHGTFFESHDLTNAQSLTFGMDLSPLIKDINIDVSEFVGRYITRFENEVRDRINAFQPEINQ